MPDCNTVFVEPVAIRLNQTVPVGGIFNPPSEAETANKCHNTRNLFGSHEQATKMKQKDWRIGQGARLNGQGKYRVCLVSIPLPFIPLPFPQILPCPEGQESSISK
jgi:hypothetical protein